MPLPIKDLMGPGIGFAPTTVAYLIRRGLDSGPAAAAVAAADARWTIIVRRRDEIPIVRLGP